MHEMFANAETYLQYAQETLDTCWNVNKFLAHETLEAKPWSLGSKSLLDIAGFIEAKDFIAHPCCQVRLHKTFRLLLLPPPPMLFSNKLSVWFLFLWKYFWQYHSAFVTYVKIVWKFFCYPLQIPFESKFGSVWGRKWKFSNFSIPPQKKLEQQKSVRKRLMPERKFDFIVSNHKPVWSNRLYFVAFPWQFLKNFLAKRKNCRITMFMLQLVDNINCKKLNFWETGYFTFAVLGSYDLMFLYSCNFHFDVWDKYHNFQWLASEVRNFWSILACCLLILAFSRARN